MRRANCPLCGARTPDPFLQRDNVPAFQNAPLATREAAREVARGRLDMTACEECGFIHNASFDATLMDYSPSYENTQACSPLFEDYLEGMVRHLVDQHALRDRQIVEIGCGKGHFLRRLCRVGGNRGIGFDPSYDGPDEVDDGQVRFVREMYDETHTATPADLVCCRHVLEHLPDPLAMLSAVHRATGGRRSVGIFFEVPTVEWILQQVAYWDFFHEHCNYFTPASLTFAFARAGFEVLRTTTAFAGQYLWLEARAGNSASEAQNLSGSVRPAGVADALAAVREFTRQVEERTAAWRGKLDRWHQDGGCALWGAGAKGVTLLNLLDPDGERVAYVVDINPRKQGMYVPGTGHAMVSPQQMEEAPVSHIVVMNPNYLDEIRAEARRRLGNRISVHSL